MKPTKIVFLFACAASGNAIAATPDKASQRLAPSSKPFACTNEYDTVKPHTVSRSMASSIALANSRKELAEDKLSPLNLCPAGQTALFTNNHPGLPKGFPLTLKNGPCTTQPGAGNALYCYATAEQVATNEGAEGFFTQHQPFLSPMDFHTVSELAVESSDKNHLQRVEVGWTIDESLNHDSAPHLFVGAWIGGAFQGYNVGFTESQGAKHSPTELVKVTDTPIQYAIQYTSGNWYITYDGDVMGFFPASLWQGNNSFTSAGRTLWFGEVAASSGLPNTAMGNGILGTKQGAASVTNMGLIVSGSVVNAMAKRGAVTNPTLYDIDQAAGPPFSAFNYGGPGASSGKAVFSDSQNLWVTDGTYNGTKLVAPIANVWSAGLFPELISPFGSKALFSGYDASGTLEEWITDGTGSGTVNLTNPPGLPSPATPYIPLGSKELFITSGNGVNSLWSTDGTTAQNLTSAQSPKLYIVNDPLTPVTPIGATAVFYCYTNAKPTPVLCATDGTIAGTSIISDKVNPLTGGQYIAAIGSEAIFAGQDPNTNQISVWSTNGRTTQSITGSPSDPGLFYRVGNVVLFYAPNGNMPVIWQTDGLTVLALGPIANLQSVTGFEAEFGNRALFLASDTKDQQELWVTDGTAGGTIELTDPAVNNANTQLNPSAFALLGNEIVFAATDVKGVNRLWATDGTPVGTTQISNAKFQHPVSGLTVAAGKVLFSAPIGTYPELGITDGTSGDVDLLKKFLNPASIAQFESQGLFSYGNGGYGILGKTDGTKLDTRQVNPGPFKMILNITPVGN